MTMLRPLKNLRRLYQRMISLFRANDTVPEIRITEQLKPECERLRKPAEQLHDRKPGNELFSLFLKENH